LPFTIPPACSYIQQSKVAGMSNRENQHLYFIQFKWLINLHISKFNDNTVSLMQLTVRQVKLFICSIKCHAMKMYGGVEVQLQAFLNSALDGGEWSASCPGHFTPGKHTLIHTVQEARWAPEPVWIWLQREKSLLLLGIKPWLFM